MKNSIILLSAIIGFIFTLNVKSYAADDLIIYSARNEQLIKPIFDEYTAQTGQNIQFTTDKAGPLLHRLKAEGKNTQADILITVDAGNLWHAANEDILDVVNSDILKQNIPANLRDPNNKWFGFSIRARTIMYNPDKVTEAQLSSYADLGNDEWINKLCLRTSKKVYNQSLIAMMISRQGIEKTEKIIKSWVANLATPPFSNDTKMIEAIAAGQCDVGIANTYYFGRILKKNPDLNVKLFWPTKDTGGVHVNISGAGIVKHSDNKEAAIKFLEWLSSDKAQSLFADLNMEYPVNKEIKPSEIVASWGEFVADDTNLSKAGELQIEAVKLMDRAKYK